MGQESSKPAIVTHASVWYEIEFFWAIITYIKSAGMLFFEVLCKEIRLWAFKWATFHHQSSRGCKLWRVKSGGLKNLTFWILGWFYESKSNSTWTRVLHFFEHPTLTGHSLAALYCVTSFTNKQTNCSPLSCGDE